jgi:hypothetical protein
VSIPVQVSNDLSKVLLIAVDDVETKSFRKANLGACISRYFGGMS